MRRYEKEEWFFLNCNSPADLCAQYGADHSVVLQEYDRCRNGHMLVSGFRVDGGEARFTTRLLDMEDGAGVGFYYGSGGYNAYVLAVFENDRVSLRIPNGVPLGDTFRYDGTKRYYELGEASVPFTLPLWAAVELHGQRICVRVNEKEILSCDLPKADWRHESPRIILQALSVTDAAPVTTAVFQEFDVSGVKKGSQCKGRCIWEKDSSPAGHVSLHLAGERDCWTETDARGNFVFADLPAGEYSCVAAGEKGFSAFSIQHCATGDEVSAGLRQAEEKGYRNPKERIYQIPEPESGRTHIPGGELTDSHDRICLDGIWQFAWDPEGRGEKEGWFDRRKWQRRIQVPFSWQSLTAFGEAFLADAYDLRQNNAWTTNPAELGNTGWYQRTVCPPKEGSWDLVIGAVNGFGNVWLNQEPVGSFESSCGPVRFFLGSMQADREYRITIQVTYPFDKADICKGKQGFWFTDAPGIWQDVWLEEQRELRITDILLSYEFVTEDLSRLRLKGQVAIEKRELCREADCGKEVREKNAEQKRLAVEVLLDGKVIKADVQADERSEESGNPEGVKSAEEAGKPERTERLEITEKSEVIESAERPETLRAIFYMELDQVHLWSPEDPFCYELKARISKDGRVVEESARKAAFRLIETVGNRLFLNRKPFYMRGVLDQGYNPWGLYTYPAIEGMEPGTMEFDIRKAKEYGYNLIRMHIKDNEPDWYRICDETGMLVWDEMPVSFYATFRDEKWRINYEQQLKRMIRKQNYHPSVIVFSTFNESWGISGDHERSPWDEPEGQAWQKEMAQRYRTEMPQILLVDNSGYAKTGLTQLLDYHMYPVSYSEARDFYGRLTKQNYPGSVFNCYAEENKTLMKEDMVRDLLQRTCRMDLKETDFQGKECQSGQPVIISEFLHINQVEQMVRLYPEIAGFVRMNLSSQENEDTSPLTNTRMERDFGYVHSDFSSAGYGCVNSKNLVLPDYPPLTRQKAGSTIEVPVSVSLWDGSLSGKRLQLRVIGKGIDDQGQDDILFDRQEMEITAECYQPYEAAKVCLEIPFGMKGAYWFCELWREEQMLCDSSIQMEILEDRAGVVDCAKNDDETCEVARGVICKENCVVGCHADCGAICNAARPVRIETAGIFGHHEEVNPVRHLFWMAGAGELVYHLPVKAAESDPDCDLLARMEEEKPYGHPSERTEKGTLDCHLSVKPEKRYILRLEASTCECINGTRLSDTRTYEGRIHVSIGENSRTYTLPDAPWDRRALFSNSAGSSGDEVLHQNMGTYGYGYRLDIPVEHKDLQLALERGYLTLRIRSEETGVVLYGERMGRYGADPMLLST